MKQTITSLFFLISLSTAVKSQNEANIWYFGEQAGVDFNSGSPVPLTNCIPSFAGYEGVGTVSDTAGNLLFYTDGNTVYNKNHAIMANGSGLFSNQSSTQTGLSIKMPGNDSLYYIFHIDIFPMLTLYYSILDISQNGGLGNVIQKNIFLRSNVTEKATAVNHSNGTDIWIITHDYNNTAFVAFLLTSSGLNTTPVITNVGPVYTSEIGYLKASPQADKLASANFYMGSYSIYDFDNSTGMVSSPTTSPPIYIYPYGIEWSPDGTKLYGGAENSNDLYQFDVSAGANVWNTAYLVYETSSYEYEALQLGPDGKIYCSRYATAWLGVVNEPDSAGAACNFVDNGVDLLGRICWLGLPNYNQSLFKKNLPSIQPQFAANDTDVCEKFCIDFVDSTMDAISWQWEFQGGAPATSASQNPLQICYSTAGIYDVTLIVCTATACDTVTLADYITVYAAPAVPAITQNGNVLTSSPAVTYQWQFNSVDIAGATAQSYTVTQSGLYTVVVGDSNNCTNYISILADYVGIDETETQAYISIYPNPAGESVTVSFPLMQVEINVEILDAVGCTRKQIRTENTDQVNLNLSGLAAGTYFIQVNRMHLIPFMKR